MLKNQLLQQAQAKIDSLVTDQERYKRLVKAGSDTIYNKDTFAQLSDAIRQSDKPVEDVARGICAVMQIMAHKARGTIPHDVFLQAGMALLFDALDFIEQAGLVTVDNDVLNQATSEFIEAMLPLLGLPAGKLESALEQVKGTMADPQRMEQFKASQGGQQ